MVDLPIDTGVRKIGDSILTSIAKSGDEEWFDEDITILLSNINVLGTIVVDFAFSVSSVMEYTLDSGVNFIAFNNGEVVAGVQSRFIDVTKNSLVNFRATLPGNLIRCIVSSVP